MMQSISTFAAALGGVGLCALLFTLGLWQTFHKKWALSQTTVLLFAGTVFVLFALLALLSRLSVYAPLWACFLAAVLLASLTWPMPISRLRTLDASALWMVPALCPLYVLSAPDKASALLWVGILVQMALFVLLYKVIVRRANRLGLAGAAALESCAIASYIALQSAWSLLPATAGVVAAAIAVSMPKKKPLVLFDLDGTLIDSQPLVFETFRQVFAKTKPGYKLSEKELYSFFGPTLEATFSKYFPEEKVPEIIDLYQQINLELHKDMLEPMPHAKDLLQSLQDKGYDMAIVSNKRKKPVLLGLELSGLAPYFKNVYGKEDQPECKPAPQGLMAAAQEMGYSNDQILYVGDNAADIQAAKNMGAFSVGFTIDSAQRQALENAKSCALLDDLRQLEDVLEKETLWIDKSIW